MSAENCSTESPFFHVLDPPLDSDAPHIRDLKVSSPQVGDPGNSATSLTQGRRDLAEDILPPVTKLPPELLCDIFRLSLPDGYLHGSKDAAPPWTLGHICRLWRMTAVGYSFLWSFVIIRANVQSNRAVVALQCQLFRSNTATLSIFLRGGDDVAFHPAVLSVLIPSSPRWKLLQFRTLYAPNELSWVQSLQGNLPLPETLELLDCRHTGVRIPDVFSRNVPRLRNVKLFQGGFADSSPTVDLPLAQLTYYRAAWHPEVHAACLSRAQNLEVCVLAFLDSVGGSLPAIHLPRLRTLHLEEIDFLSCLTAPSREHLSAFANTEAGIQTLNNILPFLQRSGCAHKLRELALLELTMTPSQLVELLRSLPALEALALESLDWDIEPAVILELLVVPDTERLSSDPILCPKLASLTYGYPGKDSGLAYLDLVPAIARSRALFPSFQPQKFTVYIYQCHSLQVIPPVNTSFHGLADDGGEICGGAIFDEPYDKLCG
ncbi:hypothetical protein C8F01DRAFT_1371711 [Mycena amicta]|nr:hypothetical protein C8F01DRAFT_1371711 [Mycena amicta]